MKDNDFTRGFECLHFLTKIFFMLIPKKSFIALDYFFDFEFFFRFLSDFFDFLIFLSLGM